MFYYAYVFVLGFLRQFSILHILEYTDLNITLCTQTVCVFHIFERELVEQWYSVYRLNQNKLVCGLKLVFFSALILGALLVCHEFSLGAR